MSRDPFEMEAGGNTADYVATIDSVSFAEGKYGFQATFNMKYDTPRPKDDGTLSLGRPEFVSVGDNTKWVAIDDGTAFVATSGDMDARVQANSRFGRWLERVLELVGRTTLLEEGRNAPYTEAFWKGLRFHFETEGAGKDYAFEDKETGEKKVGKTQGYTIPTEYLGTVAGGNGHAAAFDPASLGLPDDVLDILREKAGETSSASEFMAAALSFQQSAPLDPVVKAQVASAIGQKGLYEALQTF